MIAVVPFFASASVFFRLQRIFFVCSVSLVVIELRDEHSKYPNVFGFIATRDITPGNAFLKLAMMHGMFLVTAFVLCLQRNFFVSSASFLFETQVFCLQRIFFVCNASFLFLFRAHLFCFAACPLWAIVARIYHN